MKWHVIPSAAAVLAGITFAIVSVSLTSPVEAQFTGCHSGTSIECDRTTETWCTLWAEPDLTIGTSTKTGGKLCLREFTTTYIFHWNTWPTGPGGGSGGTSGGSTGGNSGAGGNEDPLGCGDPDLWSDDGATCGTTGGNAS